MVLDGRVELGLEVVMHGPRVVEVRPHTGIPEPYILSPAFVNAHSHLEYRGLAHLNLADGYLPWVRELIQRKSRQTLAEVRSDCETAAWENRRAGVAYLGEHSDRPGSATAMRQSRLQGVLYHELIVFLERNDPQPKLQSVLDKAIRDGAEFAGPSFLALHAYHTVSSEVLRALGQTGEPFSMHVAEVEAESELTLNGTGFLADFTRSAGLNPEVTGKRLIPTLVDLGLLHSGAQFVHVCDVTEEEIEQLARAGVAIAHCPRSNRNLRCGRAPIRRFLNAGLRVGLGLDSVASAGPIDPFEEMAEAIRTSQELGEPLTDAEVWRMATTMGHRSLPLPPGPPHAIVPGAAPPMIKIHVPGAYDTETLIFDGDRSAVEWLEPDPD